LKNRLDLALDVPPDLDTDRLGTFSGEVERPGSPTETAVLKARLGMAQSGCSLGLASEGSFGPHPAFPFVAAARELLVFIDDERGLLVRESLLTQKTNYAQFTAAPGDHLDDFLRRVRFPSHALIVRPNDGWDRRLVFKGINDRSGLESALIRCSGASSDGRAWIETDMRAHCNPTRLATLRVLARALADRIATPCPACGAPGWGEMDVVRGLPCGDCGASTGLVQGRVFGCALCSHRQAMPRSDERRFADPGDCPHCNP
jgi:hypothetical protein